MLLLEMKIVILTCIYFVGWFLFEKVFAVLWDKLDSGYPTVTEKKSTHKGIHLGNLGVITPLDQTTRYIKGLKHADWRVRRISCIQLGDKRGTAVVEALIQALRDPKEEVSMAAGDALAKIGDPLAASALTEHIENLERKMQESFERSRAA